MSTIDSWIVFTAVKGIRTDNNNVVIIYPTTATVASFLDLIMKMIRVVDKHFIYI